MALFSLRSFFVRSAKATSQPRPHNPLAMYPGSGHRILMVSRHPGAVAWLTLNTGLTGAEHLRHLPNHDARVAGDVVTMEQLTDSYCRRSCALTKLGTLSALTRIFCINIMRT